MGWGEEGWEVGRGDGEGEREGRVGDGEGRGDEGRRRGAGEVGGGGGEGREEGRGDGRREWKKIRRRIFVQESCGPFHQQTLTLLQHRNHRDFVRTVFPVPPPGSRAC